MNENERNKQAKNYEEKLKKDVKAIFKKYLDSTTPFESLQHAKDVKDIVDTFQAIKFNTDDEKFQKFIDALIEKDLANHFTYQIAFNSYGGSSFFGYSALIEAMMEIKEYVIPDKLSKKLKTYFTDYIHVNQIDLSVKKFDSFMYISKRVNWPRLINHSIHYGLFGNNVSAQIIKEHMRDIFANKSACRYFESGGFEGFLTIISYGLLNDVKLIDMIALDDKALKVSDEMISFLREYILYSDGTKEERYEDLHSKYLPKYLPHVNIHGFEEFYWFLKDKVSKGTQLLLAMK